MTQRSPTFMSDIILISLVIWFFNYKQHLREILENGLFDSLTTGKEKENNYDIRMQNI